MRIKKMKFNKIHIAGPSGTGKTTLAKLVSQHRGIPYITTSAKNVWPKYGIKKHSDVFNLSIAKFYQYQEDIHDNRMSELTGKDTLITDRSGVDNLVYFTDELSNRLNKIETDLYINDVTTDMVKTTDIIFFLPYNFDDQSLPENDGFRIINQYYQEKINLMFEYFIRKLSDKKIRDGWKHTTILGGAIEVHKLEGWDLMKKLNQLNNIINGERWRNLFL